MQGGTSMQGGAPIAFPPSPASHGGGAPGVSAVPPAPASLDPLVFGTFSPASGAFSPGSGFGVPQVQPPPPGGEGLALHALLPLQPTTPEAPPRPVLPNHRAAPPNPRG